MKLLLLFIATITFSHIKGHNTVTYSDENKLEDNYYYNLLSSKCKEARLNIEDPNINNQRPGCSSLNNIEESIKKIVNIIKGITPESISSMKFLNTLQDDCQYLIEYFDHCEKMRRNQLEMHYNSLVLNLKAKTKFKKVKKQIFTILIIYKIYNFRALYFI